MTEEWTEVNLDAEQQQLAALPLAVVDPLVHEVVAGLWRAWFFSRYVDEHNAQLRIRILWTDETAKVEGEAKLSAFLDAGWAEGAFRQWFAGSHGKRGEAYPGEADDFGPEMWPITYSNWMSGCEMALVLLRHQADGTLTKPLEYHWSRRLHMFSNALGLSYQAEATLCVRQAQRYGWSG